MDVREVIDWAQSLPEMAEGEHGHRTAFRVGRGLYLVVQPGEEEVLLWVAPEERTAIVASAPDAFEEVLDARGRPVQEWITVHLAAADESIVLELIEDAWRRFAPRRAIKAPRARGPWMPTAPRKEVVLSWVDELSSRMDGGPGDASAR